MATGPISAVNDGAGGSKAARAARPAVDAILPLSSLQSALWVHGRRERDAEPGRVEVRLELHGALDPDALGRAWQLTVDGFEALRTTINADERGEPLLVCRRTVEASFTVDDLRAFDADGTARALDAAITAERRAPLPLARAPSSRLRCVLLEAERSVLVWSCHHLLLDGWSSAVVANALLANYRVALGHSPAAGVETLPYSAYRRALKARDDTRSRHFWRELLRGHERAARLGGSDATMGGERVSRELPLLDTEASERLRERCRRDAITPATLIGGAWALLLGALDDVEDIVIALASSGRPHDLPGIDTTAGFLSNVVPLRVSLDATWRARPTTDWLRELQARQFAASEHEHIPYAEILAQAEPAFAREGVDSLLVIENLPPIAAGSDHALVPGEYRSDLVSGFPLTATVLPLGRWTLRLDVEPQRFDERWTTGLAEALTATLVALATDDARTPDELLDALRASLPRHLLDARRDHAPTGIVLREEVLDALVPPDDLAELTMLGLWEDLLQQKPLSMDADFFALGGSSVLALGLIAAVEAEFGRRVPVQRFAEAPTPRAMLRAVESAGSTHVPIPSLMTLRPAVADTVEPALFCLHAGGGHALFYRDFARRLGGGRAVHALQPKGIDGLDEPLGTIEAMAAHYIDEIVAVQPDGPYHILCYCFGGGLILEMAKRLHAEGRTVGHLIVLDAPAPIPSRHPMARFGWRAYLVYELLRQGRWRSVSKGFRRVVHALRYRRLRSRGSGAESATTTRSRPSRVQHACKHAFESYRAEPSRFELHIGQGGGSAGGSQDPYMRAWRTLAPRRQVHRLDAAHGELFLEPDVRRTGAWVDELLDSASPNTALSAAPP